MDYYHGSSVMGLTVLEPFASQYSNLSDALVYLTSSKQLALHYIWDFSRVGVKWPMLHIRQDGVLVFQEMFSDALTFLYKGLSGCVYHCVGDYEENRDTRVLTCVTSRDAVPICDYEYIDDVYEKILAYERRGRFIYERFEDRPPSAHENIRRIILGSIDRVDLFNRPDHPYYHFFKEKFSSYWQEALNMYESHR